MQLPPKLQTPFYVWSVHFNPDIAHLGMILLSRLSLRLIALTFPFLRTLYSRFLTTTQPGV